MGFKIVVLMKQVPDTKNITGDAMKADGTVNRAALPTIINPEDLHALEEALKIKEKFGATITAISLGPPTAAKVLKEGLYRGVDVAILVTDTKFAASDTLATSYALKCAIEKVGKFDLIICGRQAIDGDTAQVGPQIASYLGVNQLTCITEIQALAAHSITVKRALDNGSEVVRSKLPVLLTVVAEANEPRSPSAKLVMRFKNVGCKAGESYDEAYMHPEEGMCCCHIKQWNAEDIKADLKHCGLSGSPTKVKKIENVVLTAHAARMVANTDVEIADLMHELTVEHILG